jgi:uncharacterized membrane protein YbhN (UPF0104 family)
MRGSFRRYWPVLKALLGLAILVMIGRQFARDLRRPELWSRPLHPGWLALSGVLYLLGQGFSALFWDRLLGHLGARPPLGVMLRAYYLGQLGKYLPGKAWALLIRVTLAQSPGVSMGLATLTCFYEVLVTMASGVLVATFLFALVGTAGAGLSWDDMMRLLVLEQPPGGGLSRGILVLGSLLVFLMIVVPLHPGVFNRLAHRLSLPFRERDAARLPHIRLAYLGEGLLTTSGCWLLWGVSTAAALHGILGPELAWDHPLTLRVAAIMGLSYVMGFVIIVTPGGLGVREFCLTLLLTPELVGVQGMGWDEARGTVVLAVLVLRLVWTVAELILGALLYWLPVHQKPAATADSNLLGETS